jgi:glycosyltransferase involved in cell wall biosynthesis
MLTIFPNYAVCYKDNQYWIESSQLAVNKIILDNGIKLGISAVVDYSACEGNYTILDTETVKFSSLGVYNPNCNSFLKLINYTNYLYNIFRIIKKSNFNYIYCPGHIGLLSTLISLFLKKPFAIYLRGEWKDSTPKFFHFLFNIIIKRGKFIICTGNELAKSIKKINPNTIEVAPMSPLLYLDPFTITKNFENPIKILFVGQLIKGKGVFELIHAFQILKTTKDINIKLNIVGNGVEKNNLINLIKSFKLENDISIFSINSNNQKLSFQYASSDIFCLPTYSEGFPRVIYEALHFSLPIVTTRVGQIPTLIKEGQNGLYCNPGSAESLADKLFELINNKNLRLFLGKNGKITLNPLLNNWRRTSHGQQIVNLIRQTIPMNNNNLIKHP